MLRDTLLSLLAKITPQAPETYLRLYNNLEARLQYSIPATQTQLDYIPISSGWPAHLSVWEYFVVTASDSQGRYEIMTVNQVGAQSLHVTRGQEGTLAQAWDVDDTILSVRLTAGILSKMGRVDEVNRFQRAQSFEQGAVLHDAARVAGRLEFGTNEEPDTTVEAADGQLRIAGTLPVNIESPALHLNGLEWPGEPATLEGQTLVIEGQKIVGRPTSFYLGAFTAPPMPAFAAPPLVPGMTYYNLVSLRTMTWNGLDWVANQGLVPAVETHLTYRTQAGQVLYPLTTPDAFGNVKTLSAVPPQERVSVFLNGLKLAQDDGTGLGQYTLDYAASTLTLLDDPGEGRLQVDVLVPPERMARGAISTFAVLDLDVDWTDPDLPAGMLNGERQVFDLWYVNPQTGNREAIVSTNAPEFEVYVDGVRQRPGVSYTIADGQITFAQAPRDDSVLWAVWNRSGTDEGLNVPLEWTTEPVILGGPPWEVGVTAFVQASAQGAGGVTYTYQWLRNGAAIPDATGVNRLLNEFDVGNNLSVLVRASDGVNAPISAITDAIAVTAASPSVDAPVLSDVTFWGENLAEPGFTNFRINFTPAADHQMAIRKSPVPINVNADEPGPDDTVLFVEDDVMWQGLVAEDPGDTIYGQFYYMRVSDWTRVSTFALPSFIIAAQASDSSETSIEGTSGTITPAANGDALTTVIDTVTGPGTATVNADGFRIDYELDPNSDASNLAIDYTVTDSASSTASATATIAITDWQFEENLYPAIGQIDETQPLSAAWVDPVMPTAANFTALTGDLTVVEDWQIDRGAWGVRDTSQSLAVDQSYRARVIATDQYGNFETLTTNEETVASSDAIVPDAFTDGMWGVADDPDANGDKAIISIGATLPADNGSPLTALKWSVDGGATKTTFTSSPAINQQYQITLPEPEPATPYDVVIFATNAQGDSSVSDVKQVRPTYSFALDDETGEFSGADGVWEVNVTDTESPHYPNNPHQYDSTGLATGPVAVDVLPTTRDGDVLTAGSILWVRDTDDGAYSSGIQWQRRLTGSADPWVDISNQTSTTYDASLDEGYDVRPLQWATSADTGTTEVAGNEFSIAAAGVNQPPTAIDHTDVVILTAVGSNQPPSAAHHTDTVILTAAPPNQPPVAADHTDTVILTAA